MEIPMCTDVLAKVDAALYIIDPLWNMKMPLIRERYEPFLPGHYYWSKNPDDLGVDVPVADRREQLKGVGNAQSPFVAASAFRILVNRHIENGTYTEDVSEKEISQVFEKQKTWIRKTYGEEMGLVHTPTTMANYSAPSMMKHQGCRNFKEVFGKPAPKNAEYLMGFPLGASSPEPQKKENLKKWGA